MNARMWRAPSSRKLSKAADAEHTAADASGDDASNSASASASAKNAKLPPGWTRKESKTQKGRYYYISPSGKTQWVPPAAAASPAPASSSSSSSSTTPSSSTPSSSASAAAPSAAAASAPPAAPVVAKKEKVAVQIQYNWVHEIEIEFGEGRLGVSLREVRQLDSIPYAQFQAEVDDLPKVNGKAGPAELYNWSVKPHQRLTIGMRITFIEGTSLAGFTYKEVVDKLKRASRPVKLRFADVDQGTVEDNPEAVRRRLELQADKPPPKTSKYLEQKQAYTRVLVTSELHTELWTIETKKLDRQNALVSKKLSTVSGEFETITSKREELQKEHDKLLDEKQQYSKMIKQLKLQESHEVGNPEFIKANELAKRHAELTDDISKMGSGNKRLRKERVTLQTTLDELESALAQLGKSDEDDKNDDDLFFGIDPNAPPADQLAAIRKKMRFMEDELVKEQRKAAKVQKEMEQLNRHLTKLSGSSSGSSSSSSSSTTPPTSSSSSSASGSSSSTRPRGETRDRDSSGRAASGEKSSSRESGKTGELPTDVPGLEARIYELRKKQRTVVETMAKAAQAGDNELARDCHKKRKAVKEELTKAQDALNAIKATAAAAENTEASTSSPSRSGRKESSAVRPPRVASSTTQETQSFTKKKQQEEKMPTLSGFLEKGPTEWSERGLIRNMKTMRGARERWCEICEDGVLKYYKRRGDPVVRGEIDLSDSSFEVTCEDFQRGKEFVLCTSSQQSHFFTKSNDEMQTWVRTLRAANAYLRTNKHLDAITGKLDAADRRHGGGNSRGPPEEEFYGRATLGF